MPSSGTDKPVPKDTDVEEPKIEAVCLIPEYATETGSRTYANKVHLSKLGDLQQHFAGRFAYPFTLTVRNGLVRLGESFTPSDECYGEMPPEKRHAWLNAIRGQLVVVTRHRLPIVCLAGGFISQGLRSLEFSFVMPLASMSQRLRRKWLEERAKESNRDVWSEIFGIVYSAAEAAGTTPATFSRGKRAAP